MAWLNYVLFTYAALLAGGGIFGYVKASSTVSLLVSIAAAAIVVLGVWYAGTNRSVGYTVCFITALCLAVFFGIRVAGGSVMPGIPGLAMSLIVCACLVYAHFASR